MLSLDIQVHVQLNANIVAKQIIMMMSVGTKIEIAMSVQTGILATFAE